MSINVSGNIDMPWVITSSATGPILKKGPEFPNLESCPFTDEFIRSCAENKKFPNGKKSRYFKILDSDEKQVKNAKSIRSLQNFYIRTSVTNNTIKAYKVDDEGRKFALRLFDKYYNDNFFVLGRN